jgi:hypothetical protein
VDRAGNYQWRARIDRNRTAAPDSQRRTEIDDRERVVLSSDGAINDACGTLRGSEENSGDGWGRRSRAAGAARPFSPDGAPAFTELLSLTKYRVSLFLCLPLIHKF